MNSAGQYFNLYGVKAVLVNELLHFPCGLDPSTLFRARLFVSVSSL